MKYIKPFQSSINRAPLFHALKFELAEKALKLNKLDCHSFQRIWKDGKRLKDDEPGYYDSKYIRGISLTRDFDYAKVWNNIVFEFDQIKLRNKWKIVPYNWGYSIGGGYKQGHRMKREREEFLVMGITDEMDRENPIGSIEPLDRYLNGFWIDNFLLTLKSYDTKSLTEHPLFKGFYNKK